MENKLSSEFKNNCSKDIEEIFGEIKEFMPEIQLWQMHQSVVLDDNIKILCKATLDKGDKCIGHQIQINVLLDILYKYRLNILESSIELSKIYNIDNVQIKELFKVEQEKEMIKRLYIYQEGDTYLKYNENYDVTRTNEERDSFEKIRNDIKDCINKGKVKVRKQEI